MTISPNHPQSIIEVHPDREGVSRYTCMVDGCGYRSRWLPGLVVGVLSEAHDRRHREQRDANATNHVLADINGYKVVNHMWQNRHQAFLVFAAKHAHDEEYEYVVAWVKSLDAVEFIDPLKTRHFSIATKYFEDTSNA